jgi:transcriptional regulator with XRE-family HTH domain
MAEYRFERSNVMPHRKKEVDIAKIDAEIHDQQLKLMGQTRAGGYLRQLRAERELSMAQLGEQLGVSSAYLSNVESGVKSMSDHFIRQIADFYDVDEVTLFDLLGRVPLLAREQLNEASNLQDLLVEIKRDKKLTEDKKQMLFDQMYKLYKNFPE